MEYFGVEEWRGAARLRHACGVRRVHCEVGGARACLLDERGRAHVYAPAAAELCAVQRDPAAAAVQ